MDSRIAVASGYVALNTTAQEAQCNVQMFPPTIKQETVQCCDEKETNCDNYMCEYKSLNSPNCVNYYDGQFCVSVEVKEEFPEDECPQSSTAASCINKSPIDSNIVYENEELSKVLETGEIKQEVSEEAFSFIKTEGILGKKNRFIATTEISENYRVLGNAGDTSVLYKGQTTHQEIQRTMCGGILKNRFNSLTHNNEHIKNEPPTLVGNEGYELHKCSCCDEYFNDNNMLAHVDNVHNHKNHKSELCDENINEIHAGRNADEINYKCESCKRIYKSKSALILHLKKIHYSYGRLFECWCGEQFRTPKQLYKHERIQHDANAKSTNNAALETEFQCDICKKMFKSKINLRRHKRSIHYDYGKTFNCWCGKQFRTPKYLYRHKKNLHKGNGITTNITALRNQFQCEICKKIFIKKCNLIRHIKSIHYDYGKTFNCWCGKQFRTPMYLSIHKYRRHGGKVENENNAILKNQIQCDICKKYFKSKDNLVKHIRSIHYDYGKTFECSCGKQFRTPNYLYEHKNRQHGANVNSADNTTINTELQCDVCKKTFKRKGGLKTHILDIHYNYGKTFNCWCGKQFRTPKYLHRHKNDQHYANSKGRNNAVFKKEFQCDVCKKTFKRKGGLKTHILDIHYNYGKTFNCWCGKQFRTSKYLYRHKNDQHDANSNGRNNAAFEKEFQCDICKKTFKTNFILTRHITSIHYDYGKTFNCWCGKQFRTPKHLSGHKCWQHGRKVENTNKAILKNQIQCDICKKYFKSKDNLKIHLVNIHYDYGKMFECSCGKQFRTPLYLKLHQKDQRKCMSINGNKNKQT